MKHLRILATAGVLACAPLAAHADTLTSTMLVSATVPTACTSFSATPLNFGSIGSSYNYATATISVTCSSGAGYTIGLDSGVHPGMGGGANLLGAGPTGQLLSYNLFQDSAHSQPWGNGSGNGSVASGSGSGISQILTVYGLTNGYQAPPNSYSDTVTATLTF